MPYSSWLSKFSRNINPLRTYILLVWSEKSALCTHDFHLKYSSVGRKVTVTQQITDMKRHEQQGDPIKHSFRNWKKFVFTTGIIWHGKWRKHNKCKPHLQHSLQCSCKVISFRYLKVCVKYQLYILKSQLLYWENCLNSKTEINVFRSWSISVLRFIDQCSGYLKPENIMF